MYAEQAVLTSFGGPQGTSWSVGRDQIVAGLAAALKDFEVVIEVPSTVPYDLRGGTLAGRLGTFESTIRPRAGGPEAQLTVQAFEVLALSPTEGWQYLSDQSQVLKVTTPHPARPDVLDELVVAARRRRDVADGLTLLRGERPEDSFEGAGRIGGHRRSEVRVVQEALAQLVVAGLALGINGHLFSSVGRR